MVEDRTAVGATLLLPTVCYSRGHTADSNKAVETGMYEIQR